MVKQSWYFPGSLITFLIFPPTFWQKFYQPDNKATKIVLISYWELGETDLSLIQHFF